MALVTSSKDYGISRIEIIGSMPRPFRNNGSIIVTSYQSMKALSPSFKDFVIANYAIFIWDKVQTIRWTLDDFSFFVNIFHMICVHISLDF